MNTSLGQRHPRARIGQSARRGLVVSAIFVAGLATASLIGRDFIVSRMRVTADIYRGVVQLAPDDQGRCRRFDYDNRTGWMWPQEPMACDEMTAAAPSPRSALSSGSRGRMFGISEHFRTH